MAATRYLPSTLLASMLLCGIAHAIPPAPAGFVADPPTACGAIRLSWTPVAGVTGYHIYRNGLRLTSLSQPANRYFDYEMPAPALYTYAIQSYDETGVSPQVTGNSTLPAPILTVDPWDWFNDLFPTVDAFGPMPGTAAFAQTTAKPRTGRNLAPLVGGLGRLVMPASNVIVHAPGALSMSIYFRIKPGPGNYKIAGAPAAGLLWDPAVPAGPVACPGDASYWGPYIGGPACPGIGVWNADQWIIRSCDPLGGGDFQTTEIGAPIFPDDLFTPGTVVQYYFGANYAGGVTRFIPDPNCVMQVANQVSLDGHRWEQFTVLPDLWKAPAFGGLGIACALVVDLEDARGSERIWAGVADSLGATSFAARGGYNGWSARGQDPVNSRNPVNLDDPAYFVNGPISAAGSTWDLYSVRGWQSNALGYAGALGGRLGVVPAGWFPPGPTPGMLEAYYKVLVLLSGDRNNNILGPVIDRSQDDVTLIGDFLLSGFDDRPRGLLANGNGFATSEDANHPVLLNGILGTDLLSTSYPLLSGNGNLCADVVTQTPTTTNGDIYGVRNAATPASDVLALMPSTVMACFYQDVGVGGPYVGSVFHDVNPVLDEYWYSLVEGWNLRDLSGRFCAESSGRLAYYHNVLSNIFGAICTIPGNPPVTTDVGPEVAPVRAVAPLRLRNNPLRSGEAEIAFTLGAPDRVETAVYDLSGRRVRDLAARTYDAGAHAIRWNGADNGGRALPAGVYQVRVRFENRGATETRQLVILR